MSELGVLSWLAFHSSICIHVMDLSVHYLPQVHINGMEILQFLLFYQLGHVRVPNDMNVQQY